MWRWQHLVVKLSVKLLLKLHALFQKAMLLSGNTVVLQKLIDSYDTYTNQ